MDDKGSIKQLIELLKDNESEVVHRWDSEDGYQEVNFDVGGDICYTVVTSISKSSSTVELQECGGYTEYGTESEIYIEIERVLDLECDPLDYDSDQEKEIINLLKYRI